MMADAPFGDWLSKMSRVRVVTHGVGFTTLIGRGGGGILVLGFAPSGSFLTSGRGVASPFLMSLGVVSFAESGEVAVEPKAG
jgi:hypothetical protein